MHIPCYYSSSSSLEYGVCVAEYFIHLHVCLCVNHSIQPICVLLSHTTIFKRLYRFMHSMVVEISHRIDLYRQFRFSLHKSIVILCQIALRVNEPINNDCFFVATNCLTESRKN